jgi:hypothetical protein
MRESRRNRDRERPRDNEASITHVSHFTIVNITIYPKKKNLIDKIKRV